RYAWDGDPDLNRTAAVLDAVAYIFERAGDRPAVVNLSLGTNGGSHDGTSVVERTMDIFLRVPGRSIVVAAGNAGTAGLHAAGTIEADRDRRLGWRFPARDVGPNQLEIWADGPLALELTDPAGNVLGAVEPGATGVLSRDDAHAGAVIGSRRVNENLEVVTTVIRPSGKAGTWQVRLLPRCDRAVRFDAWIDRDDPGQSTFAPEDADSSCTLASLACGTDTVVVGAHYALAVNRDIAPFSGQGSTRDSRDNPHLTAPGCNVRAAVSKKDRPPKRGRAAKPAPRIAMSGTSMAAPHVSGAIALLLQAYPTATATALRDALVASADRSPSREGWHAGYGFGWLNLAGALERLGGGS
ncbi:MAG TPA: S8 family serine peptidase, partial [Kaistia sp.]|nr:S8 family serine peptidase [Kaistia sp.]